MIRGLVALFLVCSIIVTCASDSPSPPDRMISVGLHRLQAHIEGQSAPAVVFDTGIGDTMERLRHLQSSLAEVTKVIAFNRAGYGQSDPGPLPRDSGREARELRALLEKAALPGPFVLVGHSLGALNAQVFASMYPDDVAGIVLLDPPPQTFIRGLKYQDLKTMADQMTAQWQAVADSTEGSGDADGKARAAFFKMIASEHREMFGESAKLAGAISSFGDTPLVVIASGRVNQAFGGVAAEFQRYWIEQSRSLTGKSTDGTFVLAEDSSHHLYEDAPDLVIENILSVVMKAREKQKQ